MKKRFSILPICIVSTLALAGGWMADAAQKPDRAPASPHSPASPERAFRLVAVETGGTKFWFPSTLVVKKGDTVKITAVSKVAAPNAAHGLQIPDFKVEEVVDEKEKIITFKADRAGIFPIGCHLHPAHIGGQLIVLDK